MKFEIGRETLSEILNAEYGDENPEDGTDENAMAGGLESPELDYAGAQIPGEDFSLNDPWAAMSSPFISENFPDASNFTEEDGDRMFAELNGLKAAVSGDEENDELSNQLNARFGSFLKQKESQIEWMNKYLNALDDLERAYKEEESIETDA